MSCDCAAVGLDEMFGERRARWDAKGFRRRGLERRSRRLLDALDQRAHVRDASLLEVGSGIAGISLSALERGAAEAHAVDASAAALRHARELAAERAVADRFSAEVADFTETSGVEARDLVVLDRVVCCYPDWRALLGRAADAARAALAFSYPRDAWYARAMIATLNGGQALLRRRFRVYLHSPAAMHRLLAEHGLAAEVIGHTGIWEMTVAVRNGAARHVRMGSPLG